MLQDRTVPDLVAVFDFAPILVAINDRSAMNVTFRSPTPELDTLFVQEATAAGLMGLKGHRSVGGLRASIYNACEPASVEALVDFMAEFETQRG